MRLLVIDGNSIANRAFYGIKLLTPKDGRYTNAVFGILKPSTSCAHCPLPARPAGTTASLPRETATACSW